MGVRGAAEGARLALGGLGLGVAAGVGAFFVEGVRGAQQYQSALVKTQVNAHLTDQQVQALGASIDKTALGTTSSGAKMVSALAPVAGEMETVFKHTLTASDANKVLAASQNLVESSGGNLQTSTKTLTDLLLVYHKNASDAAQISDTLFQAHAQLGIGTDRLGMMLQRLQPRISGSGVDMQHLLGIVREMLPAAGTGTRAMMMVGNVLSTLQNPSAMASKMLHTLGINVTDSAGKFIGFEPLVEKLRVAYNGLGTAAEKTALLHALFGRQANLAMAIIKGGRAGIEENTKALLANGTAQDAAEKVAQTFAGQLEHLQSRLEDISRVIGTVVVGGLQQLLRVVLPVIDAVTTFAEANPKLVATILAVVGAIGALVANTLILQPLLGLIGTSIAAIGGPIVLFIGGITALFMLMKQGPDALGPVAGLIRDLQTAFESVAPVVGSFIDALQAVISGRGSLADLGRAFEDLLSTLTVVGSHLLRVIEGIVSSLVSQFVAAIPDILSALSQLASAIVDWGVNSLAPALLQAFTSAVTTLIDLVGPLIGPVFIALASWVVGEIPVIGGAFAQLGLNALQALADAILKHPDRIITAIGGLFALVSVISAVSVAGTAMGMVWSAAFKAGALVSDAIVDFIPAIARFLLTKLGFMTAAGAAEGVAVAEGVSAGALGSEALTGLGAAIAGEVAGETAAVTVAGATLGGALAAAIGAALVLALPALVVAAVSAAVIAAGSFLSNFIKSAPPSAAGVSSWADWAGRLQAGVPPPGGWRPAPTVGDTGSERTAIARAAAAAAAGVHSAGGGASHVHARTGFSASAGDTYSERAMVGALGARPAAAAPSHTAGSPAALAASISAAMKHAFDQAAGLIPKAPGGRGGAAGGALAAGAVASHDLAAQNALKTAQEALARSQLQSQITAATMALKAAPKGSIEAQLDQQKLLELQHQMQLLIATQALAKANRTLSMSELQVKDAHDRLKLAQEGRIKGLHAVAQSELAYKTALDKLTLAHQQVTSAEQKLADIKSTQAAMQSISIGIGQTGEILPVGSKDVTGSGGTTVSAGGVPGGVGYGGVSSTAAPVWNVQIYLDGKVVAGAISRILFEEERQYAGPVNPLAGF